MNTLKIPVLVTFAAMTLFACLAPRASASEFESTATFRAADVLPKAILSGPNYRVDDTATSDGYLNTYTLHSRFGDFKVVSTALLHTRIAEVKAMAAMEEVSSMSQFGGSLAGKGVQTVQGAANLVVHPVDTLSGAISGVGKMFVRAQESLAESSPSQYEDSRFKSAIGYSQTKRDYARQFGVDPYSTNAVLQERLNSLASAGYAGSITGSALQALIPGGVGIAVGAVSGSAVLGEIDVSVPPTDLRRQNREALNGMGVSPAVSELFIDNGVFTPTQQTAITKALGSMTKTKGKEAFVKFLVHTDSQDLALFRQRMSQMYAGYDRAVSPLAGFVSLGRFVGAMKGDGTLVLAFPLDYLAWTSAIAASAKAIADQSRALNAAGVEMWVTGKASPVMKKQLKRLGWKLHENSSKKLLGLDY